MSDFNGLALGENGQPRVRVQAVPPGTAADFFGDLDAIGVFLGRDDLGARDPQGELVRAIGGLVAGDLERFHPAREDEIPGEDDESGDRDYVYPWANRRRRLKVIALGADTSGPAAMRVKADQLARAWRKQVRRLGLVLPGRILADPASVQATVEGVLYGNFQWMKYKSRERIRGIEEVQLMVAGGAAAAERLAPAIVRGQLIAEAACTAKGLTYEPPDRVNPVSLVEHAEKLAAGLGRVRFSRWSPERIVLERLNGLLAVGRGSAQPVTQLEWVYEPPVPARRTIVLVGKGVTYDCGGLQDKGSVMNLMNRDMAGAAAVIALMSLVDRVQPPVKVVGLAGAAENMDGPRAYKTDEIIVHRDGRTTMVGHTDAEGRLILYDQLVYARETHAPHLIIDAATLTGAVKLALGPDTIGVMSNKKGVEDRTRLIDAAHRAGEKAWPLPLSHDLPNTEYLVADYDKNYCEVMEGKIADLDNDGDAKFGAGTSKGGGFLSKAIDEKVSWVHLDIAYTAIDGPIGSPVPTLAYLLENGGA
jgi:leucyl aminopeptidase